MSRLQHRRMSKAVDAWVDAWVDAELEAPRAQLVAAHVRECWDCSSAAETARLVKRSLQRLHAAAPRRLASARLKRFAQELLRA